MKFSDRVKTYNFWVSIASAIFLIINLIGKKFNFTIDENAYNDMFTTFCSVLVLLGIIVPPTNSKGQIYYQDEDDSINSENDNKNNKEEIIAETENKTERLNQKDEVNKKSD